MSEHHYSDYHYSDYYDVRSPAVKGEVLPPDKLTITAERAGTAHREVAIAHIERVMKLGYLTGDEAGKRVAYLKGAVTKEQVSMALLDLPAIAKPGRKSLDDLTSIPTLFLAIAVALFGSIGTLGGVLMGVIGHPAAGIYLFAVPMLITGITGLIAASITLAAKADW